MTMYDESLRLLDIRKKHINPSDYNIVYMGDSWVGDKGYTSNNIFQSAMEEAEKHNPLLLIHGGDIVYTGLKENFDFFINFKNQIAPNLPFFVTIGNHEMEIVNPSGPQSVKNYEEMIGPLHYTLNIPLYDLTLISLNTLYQYIYSQYGLTDLELIYLKESLKQRNKNAFVAMHVPPQTNEWVDPKNFFTIGSKAFFEEVEGKVSNVLVSHVHAFKTTTYKHTKLILSGGGGATLLKNEKFHIVVINMKNTCGVSEVCFKRVPIGRD
jgi:Icc protein